MAASPGLITEVVESGLPVLAETPPAPDLAGLRSLWQRVGPSGRVQVAEQYPLLPSHAARLALVRSGAIGEPTQAQVSSTHQYHGIALLRAYLAVGRGPVTVRASSSTGPLVDPLSRAGWTGDDEPKPARTVLAAIDFGTDRSGLYDFTDNQWHNQLRFRRVLVRGSHGELQDDTVVRLAGPRTIVRESLTRNQTGYDLNLDGFDTELISRGDTVLYRNPYPDSGGWTRRSPSPPCCRPPRGGPPTAAHRRTRWPTGSTTTGSRSPSTRRSRRIDRSESRPSPGSPEPQSVRRSAY